MKSFTLPAGDWSTPYIQGVGMVGCKTKTIKTGEWYERRVIKYYFKGPITFTKTRKKP